MGGESLAKVLARTLKENLLMHLGQVEALLQKHGAEEVRREA